MQRTPVVMSKGLSFHRSYINLGYWFCEEEIFQFAHLITHAQTSGDYQRGVKTRIFLSCAVENKILRVAL